MPLVRLEVRQGRSAAQKRALLGVAPADVLVVLLEPPLDNWGIRGGQMASEVDLGFEVQV
jgi:phenylpyruvate tautomerase PptA (4-oxalocrotonate tautomerase family)